MSLPSNVQADAIQAGYDNGVLQLLVPKAEEAKPRKIAIAAGEQRKAVTSG